MEDGQRETSYSDLGLSSDSLFSYVRMPFSISGSWVSAACWKAYNS